MHRHQNIGRKLGRKRDERRTLVKNLATSLFLDEKVNTTLPKAKVLLPYAERLVSKAKKGGLHNRRQIIGSLLRDDAAHKLVDEIAPQMKRDSGFLRLKKTGHRRGDNAPTAEITFVDKIEQPKKTTTKKDDKPSAEAKKSESKEKKTRESKSDTKEKAAKVTKASTGKK